MNDKMIPEHDLYAMFYVDSGYYFGDYMRMPKLVFSRFIIVPACFERCPARLTQYFKLIIANVALETDKFNSAHFIISKKLREGIRSAKNADAIDNVLNDFALISPLANITETIKYGKKLGLKVSFLGFHYNDEYIMENVEQYNLN